MFEFLKRHQMEALVVGVLLVVLTLVTLPQFLQSQARARVAEARLHLEELTWALQAYRLGYGDVAHEVLLFGKRDQSGYRHAGVLLSGEVIGKSTGVVLAPHSILDAFVETMPMPTLPMEQTGSQPYHERVYAVGTFKARQPDFRDSLLHCHNADGSLNALIAYHQQYQWMDGMYWPEEYVGMSPGPYVDYSNYLVENNPTRAQPPFDWSYYTAYDPSNGVMSHGFIFTRE